MPTELTLLGNAGCRIVAGQTRVCVDAFHTAAAPDTGPADLILVTHAHWDHFDPGLTAAAAVRTGAVVAGPRAVITALSRRLPAAQLAELSPPAGAVSAARRVFTAGAVTAFRTRHGREHNSYLLELPGWRGFHDGDNEDTRPLTAAALGRLDALLLGPWQGSGWVEFIERLAPGRWFLMHLTPAELAEHAQNRFLPDICDRVPAGLVTLQPGEIYEFG